MPRSPAVSTDLVPVGRGRARSALARPRAPASTLQFSSSGRDPIVVGDDLPASGRARTGAANLTSAFPLIEQRQHMGGIAVRGCGQLPGPHTLRAGQHGCELADRHNLEGDPRWLAARSAGYRRGIGLGAAGGRRAGRLEVLDLSTRVDEAPVDVGDDVSN